MVEQEQAQMMPMSTVFDGHVESQSKVSSTCLISVQRKLGALRNGVPFADRPAALTRLKKGLMCHQGSDLVMAHVRATVPTAELESVLVAVELMVESGALNTEHVLHVLARLYAIPLPETVQTTPQLQEEPLANTTRYDSFTLGGGGLPRGVMSSASSKNCACMAWWALKRICWPRGSLLVNIRGDSTKQKAFQDRIKSLTPPTR